MTYVDHPLVVPPGYRIVCRFAWMPIKIAGQEYWGETYRVVQRWEVPYGWVDVGYFDEVMPVKADRSEE